MAGCVGRGSLRRSYIGRPESRPAPDCPAEVQFLELRERNGALWQRVMMRDAAGIFHFLDYQMVRDAEGWRINGVTLLRATGVAA